MEEIDLKARPIYQHLEGRVRAHIFLSMLAYYVEWHSFHTLLIDPATIVRNTCQRKGGGAGEPRLTMTTTANVKQKRALELLDTIVE